MEVQAPIRSIRAYQKEIIELALQRLIYNRPIVIPKDSQINISNVAKEAKINRVLIYNYHSEYVDRINQISGKNYKKNRKKEKIDLTPKDKIIKSLRKKIRQLTEEVEQSKKSVEVYKHSIDMHEIAYKKLLIKYELKIDSETQSTNETENNE